MAEIELIKQYDSRNHDKGYNIAEGGSNARHSEETKQKMSISHLGNESRTGMTNSGEMNAKIGASSQEHWNDSEYKEKMIQIHKARECTLPSFEGKTHSEETKQKMSYWQKGKPKSEEQKAKQSAAMKKRWLDKKLSVM